MYINYYNNNMIIGKLIIFLYLFYTFCDLNHFSFLFFFSFTPQTDAVARFDVYQSDAINLPMGLTDKIYPLSTETLSCR